MSRAVELQAVTVEEEGRAVTYERPDIDEPDIPCIRCSGQASARWLLYADPPPTSCMGTGCPVCGPCVKLGETGARHMPLLRSARHVAVVLAGIHGSLDVTALALLADKDSLEPLLDHCERAWRQAEGERERGWCIPKVKRVWPQWDAHGDPDGNNPHVWHAVQRRVITGATLTMLTAYGDTESAVVLPPETTVEMVPDHRCTCGLYRSKHDELAAVGTVVINGVVVRRSWTINLEWHERRDAGGIPEPLHSELCRRYGWSRVGIETSATHGAVTITAYRACGHREMSQITDTALEDSMVPRTEVLLRALHDLGEHGPMCRCPSVPATGAALTFEDMRGSILRQTAATPIEARIPRIPAFTQTLGMTHGQEGSAIQGYDWSWCGTDAPRPPPSGRQRTRARWRKRGRR